MLKQPHTGWRGGTADGIAGSTMLSLVFLGKSDSGVAHRGAGSCLGLVQGFKSLAGSNPAMHT